MPISIWSLWQFFPSFDKQHTCIADFSRPVFNDLEALVKVIFIFFTVRESWAGGFGSAYAATFQTPVDLGFVKTEHGGVGLDINIQESLRNL